MKEHKRRAWLSGKFCMPLVAGNGIKLTSLLLRVLRPPIDGGGSGVNLSALASVRLLGLLGRGNLLLLPLRPLMQ